MEVGRGRLGLVRIRKVRLGWVEFGLVDLCFVRVRWARFRYYQKDNRCIVSF